MKLKTFSYWLLCFWLQILVSSIHDVIAIRHFNNEEHFHRKRDSSTAHIALSYDTHRYLPFFQTNSKTYEALQYQTTPEPPTLDKLLDVLKENSRDSAEVDPTTKQQLALLLKQKYLEFRNNLEVTTKEPEKFFSSRIPASLRTSPVEQGDINHNSWLQTIPLIHSSSLSTMMKQLRSADEGPSFLRTSVLSSPSLPLIQSGSARQSSPSEIILEQRLGPSAKKPTFDPSIVIDFLSLIRLNQRSHRLHDSISSSERGNSNDSESEATVVTLIEKSTSSDATRTKPRRASARILHPAAQNDFSQDIREAQKFSSKKRRLVDHWLQQEPKILKRAKLVELPSDVSSNATEEMAIYISMMDNGNVSASNEFRAKEQATPQSRFGPFSQGNDPSAGISPSQVTIPNLDISQLRLPQGVRDSLSKYLKPLIATLKPLRKSVPGLPGLDYPILSVVPYTNFYCNNMPWPGFYADTEARCQTWHACDVDGRQSTFLCPNGTIFNQASMVCDWWYNVECLNAPFLYSINERLFVNLSSFKDEIKPYSRITKELLDTIFV